MTQNRHAQNTTNMNNPLCEFSLPTVQNTTLNKLGAYFLIYEALTVCHNISGQQLYKAEFPSHAVMRSWEDTASPCELIHVLRGAGQQCGWTLGLWVQISWVQKVTLGPKKEWSTNTCYNWMNLTNITPSERSQSQKVTDRIPSIGKVQNRQIPKDRK